MNQPVNKLVCLNTEGVARGLEYGELYEHVRTEGIYVWVANEHGNQQRHLKSRFRDPYQCVRCIKSFKGDNVTIGDIYEIIEIDRDCETVTVRTDRGRKSDFSWSYFEDFIKRG